MDDSPTRHQSENVVRIPGLLSRRAEVRVLMGAVPGRPVYWQKSDGARRRARPRAAAIRYRLLVAENGVAIDSDWELDAIHACVGPSDPSVEVTFASPKVHILNVQTARPASTPANSRRHMVVEAGSPYPTARTRHHSCSMVPHLAIGLLGIAVVLIWRMPEFAVVLFLGLQVLP